MGVRKFEWVKRTEIFKIEKNTHDVKRNKKKKYVKLVTE
jgi:hypothetical protein